MEFDYKVIPANEADKEALLSLYQSFYGGPAGWDEKYPNLQTIEFDLKRNAVFVIKNNNGSIIAAASLDEDQEVIDLDCWNKDLQPSGEVARICVRSDMQHRGLAKAVLRYCFDTLKQEGKKSVHLLVRPKHPIAIEMYTKLGFVRVSECHIYEKDYICMERAL